MSDRYEGTMQFKINMETDTKARDTLKTVYTSLQEKGYNPINQLVGYILSGDPTYITSYNNARSMISKIERDEIVEELLKSYLSEK
ncbi:MAG: IreB family regulatory phosphoprotein [Clostridium sp.]